ncbi:MAG: MFS transporter [Ancalomicrobiaceae bacterium]|nr:MFS transporter [Ancalomicrobiaceae bacterium]
MSSDGLVGVEGQLQASARAAPVRDEDGLPAPRRYWAIAVVLLTLLLTVLDGAIANIALPSIAKALGAAPADTVWVVSSYQLAVILALLPSGALGEKFGARRVFIAGVTLFTVASAMCALSSGLPMLVAARFLQGLGAGQIMALTAMMLRFSCPLRLLGTVIGFNAVTVAISSAMGPGVAGLILSVADWPWLFAVNLPIGAVILAAFRMLPHPAGMARRLDRLVIALNTAMFVLFFVGADALADLPAAGAAAIVAAFVCLAVLIRREMRRDAPLVPVDLFRNPAFRVAVIASVSCFCGQMMSYVALPFYLQHHLNQSITMSGLYMVPWPLAVMVVAPIVGRLSNSWPTSWMCAVGGTVCATGLTIVASFSNSTSLEPFVIGTVLAGAGFGCFQTPNNRILLLSAPKARSGAAGAMQGTARLVGQTLGAIGMALLFKLCSLDWAPRLGLFVAAGFVITASLISLMRVRYE